MVISLVDLLKRIPERPAMYGVNSVLDIQLLVTGFMLGLSESERGDVNDFMSDFRSFVNVRTGSSVDANWGNTIYFYSGSDSHSLLVFARLFGEFLESNKSDE